jgi:hypothetical protein
MLVPSALYGAVAFAPRIESRCPGPTIMKCSLVLRIQQRKSIADNQDKSQNRHHKQSDAYGIKDSFHAAIVNANRRQVLGDSVRSFTLVTFVGCVFSGALTVTESMFVAAGVLLARLLFGRRIVEFTVDLFGA